jgi:protein-S-isoprenylcysteine O-methyltransferase Ste14
MTFFDYFQIATLVVFAGALASKAIYSRVKTHVNPIAIARSQSRFQFFFELSAFAALAVWIYETLSYALHSSVHIIPAGANITLINSPVARIVGVALIGSGLIILVWAFISFGDSWRIGIDSETPGPLIMKGIFAVSRNPIYIFLNLWFFGTLFINGGLFFLTFALLAMAALHYQIIREERFLSELYGESYQDYRARTSRYFLF